jgi:hypothetical protein
MTGEPNTGMQCTEWEALLADALDGTLHGDRAATFEAHQHACQTCGTQYEEVAAGMHWLKGLDEVEIPKHLVHNIMAQTVGALPVEREKVAVTAEGWWAKLRQRVTPAFAGVVSPRFAMSFGMAFFSITMLLNIAGFRVADLKHVDLSARGLEKTYYTAQARVVRYYENIRLVYEIESRMRDLRRAATPDQKQEDSKTPKNPSKNENRQQNRNYQRFSIDDSEPVLAQCPAGAGPVTHQARLNRRTS